MGRRAAQDGHVAHMNTSGDQRPLVVVTGAGGGLGAVAVIRPEHFVPAAAVVADDLVGELEDVFGGTVIAFELVHLRPGKIFFEAEDVFQLGPAPAVNALVVIPHREQVAVHRREQAHDLVLYAAGILKFVDVYVSEAPGKIIERLFVRFEQGERFVEQVVEIHRVVLFEVVAVRRIDAADLFDPLHPAVFALVLDRKSVV